MSKKKPLNKLLSSKKSQSNLIAEQLQVIPNQSSKIKINLLNKVNSPKDLKKLKVEELPILAQNIRDKIIDTVSQTGGHLGGPLGTVELTLAVHYVFNTPKDKIVIDTGHQSYTHKLVTGRKDKFHTLRQYKGVCGFCNIFESEYDSFGAGDASTSISAALVWT